MQFGVCECFFGPTWSEENRESWALFLKSLGLDFYLYGPKADPFLRKRWTEAWQPEYLGKLNKMVKFYHANQTQIGVALSPFGLLTLNDNTIKQTFIEKIQTLEQTGFDFIGLFFDDLNYFDGLIDLQLQTLEIAQKYTKLKLVFCPSYYSYDPILDKVFGQRPAHYLERIGNEIPSNVDICWTGPKVISSEISDEHLVEVKNLLKRKPYIFDNHFANDGPKNCKFIKLKDYTGRSADFLNHISGLTINPMNQSRFSQIMVASAAGVLKNNLTPSQAFEQSIKKHAAPDLAEIIFSERETFLTLGLDQIAEEKKSNLLKKLNTMSDPAATELANWLNGSYNVGSECLTD